MSRSAVTLEVNGERHEVLVEPRKLLSDVLREDLRLTGTHVGCEHGVCGACSVILDGRPVRSCLIYAVMADGAEITTVEGLEGPDGALSPLQDAFWDTHAMQCGYCTPGMVMVAVDIARRLPGADEETVREELYGNICRCTGYQGIVEAVMAGSEAMQTGVLPTKDHH